MRLLQRLTFVILILLITAPSFSQINVSRTLERLKSYPPGRQLDSLLKYGWEYRGVDHTVAKTFLEQAVLISTYLHNSGKLAKAYNYLGVIMNNESKYDSSLHYYEKALEYALIANDSVELGYAYNNIGGHYQFVGQYFIALENIYKAENIFKRLRNYRGLAYAKLNLAKTFEKLKNYDIAEKLLIDVIRIRTILKEKENLITAKRELADLYVAWGKYDKAEKILHGLLPQLEKLSMPKNSSIVYKNLGIIEKTKKHCDNALRYLRKSMHIAKSSNLNFIIADDLVELGNCHFELGETDSAQYYLRLAEKEALAKQYFHGYISALQANLQLNYRLRNPEKIRFYTERLISIKDSLMREESIIRDKEFKKILEYKEIARNNIYLQNEVKTQQKLIFLFIAAAVLFVGFFIVIFLQNKKLKERTDELTKALNDKNKLFSIIAHDLKNPFVSLLGYADLLLEELEGDYDIKTLTDGVRHMRASTQKLLDMVTNLLEWARTQTGQIQYNPSVHPINDIILETLSYFTQSAGVKGVELKTHLTPNFKCFCDKDMISTVLRNLISNSIKFCKAGDYIKISVEKNTGEKNLYITVEDSGTGIKKENLATLFTKNTSTEGTSGEKGTGLGLLLVKEMVETNKGKLFIESEYGKGTKVTFSVPLAEN